MTDQRVDGRVRVWWVPSITSAAGPSTAELGAGTALECFMDADGLIGWFPDQDVFDATRPLGKWRHQTPGRATLTAPKLRLYKQDQAGDDIYDLLAPGALGNVVIRWDADVDVAWALDQAVQVFPVETLMTRDLPPEEDGIHFYEVPCVLREDAELRAVVGGGPSLPGEVFAPDDTMSLAESALDMTGTVTPENELVWFSDWDMLTDGEGIDIVGTAYQYGVGNEIVIELVQFEVSPNTGHLMVAFAATLSNDTEVGAAEWNTPSGWIKQADVDVTADFMPGGLAVFTRAPGGSEGDYTFTTTTGSAAQVSVVQVYLLDGANLVGSPIDTTLGVPPIPTTQTSGSTSHAAPSATTTQAESMLLCAWMAAWTSTGVASWTPPGGMTEDFDVNPSDQLVLACAHKALGAAGPTSTQTAIVSRSSPTLSIGMTVPIKKA